MTNEQWRVCADAIPMLDFLFPMHSSGSSQEQPRKLKLYFCALARVAWRHLPAAMRANVLALEYLVDEPSDQTIKANQIRELADNHNGFDGNREDLQNWEQMLAGIGFKAPPPDKMPMHWTKKEWQNHAVLVSLGFHPNIPNYKWLPRPMHRADYVRDIFEYSGFDQSTFDSNWRTTAIVEMCKRMYKFHDFSAMPCLADMLEETGCQSMSILEHCRDPHGMHARGCWVIDRICHQDPRRQNRPGKGIL